MTAQSEAAFRLATGVRMRRAEIRRSLTAKETTMANHITESAVANAYVRQVLGWQPQWGPDRVAMAMAKIGGFNPTCGQLSPRQITILARLCEDTRRGRQARS